MACDTTKKSSIIISLYIIKFHLDQRKVDKTKKVVNKAYNEAIEHKADS